MNDYRIRPSTENDALDLREIRLLALLDEPDAFGSTWSEARNDALSAWKQRARDWNYFLAYEYDGDVEGRVIGMASGGDNPHVPGTRWLYGMFVHPNARGTGVARDLVAAVIADTRERGVATLGLHVTTTLPRPRAFYYKMGFREHGAPEPMDRDPSLQLQVMLLEVGESS
jgi:GNAT superfamily N-acetyltransferase